jgi:hypothetical protein
MEVATAFDDSVKRHCIMAVVGAVDLHTVVPYGGKQPSNVQLSTSHHK